MSEAAGNEYVECKEKLGIYSNWQPLQSTIKRVKGFLPLIRNNTQEQRAMMVLGDFNADMKNIGCQDIVENCRLGNMD